MNQESAKGEGLNRRLRHVLLQQRDAVTGILQSSQELLDQPKQFNIGELEELLKRRTKHVERIEQLEKERRQLMEEVEDPDEELRAFHGEIQESLDALAALDGCLRDMVFNAQLRLINSLAFAPKYVNLGWNTAAEHHTASRVVDITR